MSPLKLHFIIKQTNLVYFRQLILRFLLFIVLKKMLTYSVS